ncbi:ATPase, T2SS/T4P/T4SS family [Marinomonas sp. C2222]|uniref:ATPase, T2SS/T4P/T4SS family n=1 Tax=Marinomonas sargassi TaxID=2984494 RepID=A0ABT2YSM6_9GAMM|nr:ATPase, T2SS/T4P/T4SS family [Marinomonas sargassi]MCV2402891.1 ATPase, T2SS/T4P/T4SS family [Marinomonas sargassi]
MMLEEIISKAIDQHVTDIHIEDSSSSIRVFQRHNGALYKTLEFPHDTSLLNRIKIRANLDLSETRRTQEGQFLLEETNRKTFIRVSIIATVKGEKVALRLLPDRNRIALQDTGMSKALLNTLHSKLDELSGLIFVCGATGAGKTTTLYSCLDNLNQGDKSIFTIEDPVEYKTDGTFQCEPNIDIGLDAPHLLKSFMRQDPDVIMVGEIRDATTANLAVNAALTGHLVLATLHTNSPIDAIHRCHGWNVDFFSLASSLQLIIHQSMSYQTGQPQPIFNALQPKWTTPLPSSYQTLIENPELWNVFPHE